MKKLNMYIIIVLSLSLLFGTILVNAAEPKMGGTLKVAVTAFPPQTDPAMHLSSISREVMHQVFEGLVVYDDNYKIVPMLAKSWEVSEDGKTYTFYLREGIKFHNGKEMTAEDVIASIDRTKKVTDDILGLDKIENMHAKDKYTVVVELQEKTPAFLVRLATEMKLLAIMPKEIIEGIPARGLDTIEELIGTGPFKYEEIVADQYVKLTRFSEYKSFEDTPSSARAGRKVAYVDEIFFYPVVESGTRLAGIEAGEYDIVRNINIDAYSRLQENPDVDVMINKPGYQLILMFNTEQGLMKDQKLRQAIQHALDSEEILMAIRGHKDFYDLNGGLFAKSQIWYNDEGLEHYNLGDVEGSRKMVEDLGYKGQEIRIVTTKDIPVFYQASVVVAEQLKRIGLEPKIKIVDWATNVDKFLRDWSDWELSFTYFSLKEDPATWSDMISSTHNYPYISDELDQILENIGKTTDFEKRYELCKELQNLIMNDIPIYNIGSFFEIDVTRSNVHGYKTFKGNPIFWNVWKD